MRSQHNRFWNIFFIQFPFDRQQERNWDSFHTDLRWPRLWSLSFMLIYTCRQTRKDSWTITVFWSLVKMQLTTSHPHGTQRQTVLKSEVRMVPKRKKMCAHFDTELRQPVSLQHILEQIEKKTKTAFSALWQAVATNDSFNKMPPTYQQTRCTACAMGTEIGCLWHAKNWLVHKHTLHTIMTVCEVASHSGPMWQNSTVED